MKRTESNVSFEENHLHIPVKMCLFEQIFSIRGVRKLVGNLSCIIIM